MDLLDVAQDFAKRTTENNYDEAETEKLYRKRNKEKNPITFASIIKWAKEDSPSTFLNKVEAVQQPDITYYDEMVNLLQKEDLTVADVQKWQLGCTALVNNGENR